MTERRAVEVEKVVRLIVEALVGDAKEVTIKAVARGNGIHFAITAGTVQVEKLIGKTVEALERFAPCSVSWVTRTVKPTA